jgi:hypothetical protein
MSFLEGPSALVSHLNDDALIGLGFDGMRGMDEANLMTSAGPDPPPMSRTQFAGETERWLRAMDFGQYFSPADPDQTCAWVTGAAPPPSATGPGTTTVPGAPAVPPAPPPGATTGSIRGIVTDAATNALLAGANVASGPQAVSTAPGGGYQLDGIGTGLQSVSAAATGYETISREVAVTAGVVELNFALRPYTVSGTVRNSATNQPIQGATVSGGGRTATTDSGGRYLLSAVPPGPLRVEVAAAGFRGDAADLPSLSPGEAARTRDFILGSSAEAPRIVSLTCPSAASINEPVTCTVVSTGTVTGTLWAAADGNPASGSGASITTRFGAPRAYPINVRVCNDPQALPGGQPSSAALCATDQRTVSVGSAAAPTTPAATCPVTGTEITACVIPGSGPRPNTVRVEGRNIKRLNGVVPPNVCLYFGADVPPQQLACGAPDAAGTVVFANVGIPTTGRCEPVFGLLSCALTIMDNPSSPTVTARTFYQVTSGG